MSTPIPPTSAGQPTAQQGNFEASSLLVSRRPDELGVVLREDEFQILCDGEINEDRAGRNFFFGLSWGALVGLVGLAGTTDWDVMLHQGRKGPLLLMFALAVLVAGPGMATIVYHRRYTRTRDSSPYSRLKKRLAAQFKSQTTLNLP